MGNKRDFVPRLAFFCALLFFGFLGGFAAYHFKVWPYRFLKAALTQGAEFEQRWKNRAEMEHHHLYPARHELVGARRVEGAELQDGVILLASYWADDGGQPGLRVIDRDGNVLHAWNTNPHRIWQQPPHRDAISPALFLPHNYVHGTHLFENGDVLFNIEWLGLVRLNAAGDVLWTLRRRTHHSISRNERGNFWVSSAKWLVDQDDLDRRFPGLGIPLAEDIVLEVTPDGEIVREASVLEAVYGAPDLRRLLWTNTDKLTGDVIHLNDVEELPSAMAGSYPGLDAGDLIASVREIDLVFVFDPDSLQVKWWRNTPFIMQHDPDFVGGGKITVFDNNCDHTNAGDLLGGSRLLVFDVKSRNYATVYPAGHDGERQFYTPYAGKAQRLAGGHWLLTEARAGRVFEVDEKGRTIWEWVQERHADDENYVAEVTEGTLYPISPATVKSWSSK